MVRTQIYLTERERIELNILSEETGRKQSELIREAVDHLLEKTSDVRRKSILKKAAGIWKNRRDMPDFRKMRVEWDRK